MDKAGLRNKITAFLEQRFLIEFAGRVDANTDLFAEGFIDSFGFIELVSFLENEFKVEFQPEELMLGDINSLEGLSVAVDRKLAEAVLPQTDGVSVQS